MKLELASFERVIFFRLLNPVALNTSALRDILRSYKTIR